MAQTEEVLAHSRYVNRYDCNSMWQCWNMAGMGNGMPGYQVVVLEHNRNANRYILVTVFVLEHGKYRHRHACAATRLFLETAEVKTYQWCHMVPLGHGLLENRPVPPCCGSGTEQACKQVLLAHQVVDLRHSRCANL